MRAPPPDIPKNRRSRRESYFRAAQGPARSWRPAGSQPLPTHREGAQFTWFLSARTADVAGALATAACRTRPGREDHVRPYDSMGQVREALRPHLLDQPGWERLRDAARAWQDARRAASPLLSRAVKAMGSQEFTSLSGAYHAAIATANAGYRHQYAQASGHESESS